MLEAEIVNLVIKCPFSHCRKVTESITVMIGHLLIEHGIIIDGSKTYISDRSIKFHELIVTEN